MRRPPALRAVAASFAVIVAIGVAIAVAIGGAATAAGAEPDGDGAYDDVAPFVVAERGVDAGRVLWLAGGLVALVAAAVVVWRRRGRVRGRGPEGAHAGAPAPWWSRLLRLALAGVAGLAVLFAAASLYYALRVAAGHPPTTVLLLVLKPALLAAVCAAALAVHDLFRGRSRALAAAVAGVTVAAFVVVYVGRLWSEGPGAWHTPVIAIGVAVAASLLVGLVLPRLPGTARLGSTARFWLATALTALVLGLLPPVHGPTSNRFGLLAYPPNSVIVADHGGEGYRRDYPVITYEHNAIGYRDVAPPGPKGDRERVLVVGDSFVWGDGSATNADTLGAHLRATLEAEAPGRYEVMAAAYQGLGIYGFSRFVTRLQPHFAPDVVVLGYLGGADFDPFDNQYRFEKLPPPGFLRDLVLNLGAAMQLHEASVVHSSRIWNTPPIVAWIMELLRGLQRHAEAHGYHLMLFHYGVANEPPGASLEGLDVVRLPPERRYESGDRDLWWEEVLHPKPRLNRLIAEQIAAAILARAAGGGGSRPGDPLDGAAGGI